MQVRLQRVTVVLTLLLLAGSGFSALAFFSPPSWAQSGAPLLNDDFTHDTSLNTTLWLVNGHVGMNVGAYDIAFPTNITLVPSFSSVGMEIAQANRSFEAGTIQSVESFTPPFTLTAVVEGTASNGHTFGLAISSADATSGVLVYGNVNPTNCSHLGDCGDPAVCGTPVNSSVPANQCYYGIDVKVANGTAWPHVAKLYLTPSLNVFYTLQISVDASGSAQYSIGQGGQGLGQGTAQVGTGPFYIVLEQAEGAPVPGHGSNQAYWSSVSLGPLQISTSSASTSPSVTTSTSTPGTTTPGISTNIWIIIIIIIAAFLFLFFLLWYRRRNLTITVQDSQTLSPIPEAGVSAEGPEELKGFTRSDGKITFKGVRKGDYTVKAGAPAYVPSMPVKVEVKKTMEYVIRLDRSAEAAPVGAGGGAPPSGPPAPSPSLQTRPPETMVAQPVPQGPAATPAKAQPAPQPQEPQEPELEGWGGGRISEIIRTFKAKGAISPETALTAEELGLSRLFVRIMKRRQGRTRVFMEINGRYYLNQKALEEMK